MVISLLRKLTSGSTQLSRGCSESLQGASESQVAATCQLSAALVSTMNERITSRCSKTSHDKVLASQARLRPADLWR
jgi:hypothetical protein